MMILKPVSELAVGDVVMANGYPADVLHAARCKGGCCMLIMWGHGAGEWTTLDTQWTIRVLPRCTAEPWTLRGAA